MQESPLQSLTEWLEEALERQETLLAVCIAQGEAARARDLGNLEARTAALQVLIEQAAQAEQMRDRLVASAAGSLGLESAATLSSLAQAAPAPWGKRLKELQLELRSVLTRTRIAVRENSFMVRRQLQRVDQVMQVISPPQAQAGYAAPGTATPQRTTLLLNARG